MLEIAFWLLEPELKGRIFICRWTRYQNQECRWLANGSS